MERLILLRDENYSSLPEVVLGGQNSSVVFHTRGTLMARCFNSLARARFDQLLLFLMVT